jgi:hypothetical protein
LKIKKKNINLEKLFRLKKNDEQARFFVDVCRGAGVVLFCAKAIPPGAYSCGQQPTTSYEKTSSGRD